jgi:TetR/AcrR family transcriptional repressor of mexJK operon
MSVAPAPGRREQRKQDRRCAILAAARRSFLEEGYAATSMSGLLKTLGGSKTTIWSYFRSKEELFAAVVEDATRTFREEVKAELSLTGDLEDALSGFCRSLMTKVVAPEALATWRLVVAESARFPEVGRIFYALAAHPTQATLSKFIAYHIRAARLRDEDAERMANMLINMCSGLQNRCLWGVSVPQPDEIKADASAFAKYFLLTFST